MTQTSTKPSSIPTAAKVVSAVALVVAATHIFLTAVFNVPSTEVKYTALPGAAADAYIRPYFVQDYRIFAPDPASADRDLWVRAWVEKSNGERVETKWVDVTAIELAEPYRRVLRKQLTVIGAEQLMTSYGKLSEAQKAIAERNFHDTGDLAALNEALLAVDGANANDVRAFIRATNYTTSYATQAARALWADDGEIIAVQTRSVYSPVVRWEDRNDPDAVRPSSSYTRLGWRPVLEWSQQSEDAFARTFLHWADAAGVTGSLTDDEDAG
ncbi:MULTISPECIES: DUF5819 family protein [unclassified Microbacterium]|uniref:DUF5819 family protein n=1 Tax=unclassified Microbacterium TaxID=2609290 RepID=UPI0030161303